MNLAVPFADLVPGARGQILATLVQVERPMTVRALARHAGVSAQGAATVVNDLSRAGLVLVEPAGNARLVRLNRQHLAAEPLGALVALRVSLVGRLSQELSGWTDLAGAWLFGSAARGDGGRDSDVDLLLVTSGALEDRTWEDRTAHLEGAVRAWTGNPLQVVEHDRTSFSDLVATGNPLVEALRTDGVALTHRSRALLRRTP